MISEESPSISLERRDSRWVATFAAMASPCEIHVRDTTEGEAGRLASLAFSEANRIERKFSRYRPDSVVHQINTSHGTPVVIDAETFTLLNYAGAAHRLSEGLFDVTSGVLRRAWRFDGQAVEPDRALIASLLALVGWDRVALSEDQVVLRPGMEIDLGGLGKEYAVDRVAQMLIEEERRSIMVNFGGDIRVIGCEPDDRPWDIGIERPGHDGFALGLVSLAHGAVATSGDSRRYCLVAGRRHGHILNPRTGWPVENAPQSVTVVADYCLEAGLLATLAILQGAGAEDFLRRQGVKHHCVRAPE